MTGVFITNWQLPVPLGVLGGVATGALAGSSTACSIAKLKIPPFIATLGMMMWPRGCRWSSRAASPIYFNDTPVFNEHRPWARSWASHPGLRHPQRWC